MKTIIRTCILLLILATGKTSVAQTLDLDSLLCKSWRADYYEAQNKRMEPLPTQKNDRMIFFFDHKVKSYEGNVVHLGNWDYDPLNKMLIIIDAQNKSKAMMKLKELNKRSMTWEFNSPDGQLMRLHMVPAARNKK